MKYIFIVLFALSFVVFHFFAIENKEFAEKISGENLYKTVEYLASDELGGRLAGSAEYNKAANYAAGIFAEVGLKPYSGDSYLQEFKLEYNHIKGTPELKLMEDGEVVSEYEIGKDFICRGFTGSGDVISEVVFAGYGISRPDEGYDDYKNLDVKNKIVMVFKYNPRWKKEGINPGNGYPREKSRIAREHGAKGILFVSLPNDKNPQAPILSVMAGEGQQDEEFPQLHVDLAVADDLFAGSGKTLKELQTLIDSTKEPASLRLKSEVHIKVDAEYYKNQPTYNVAGIWEGSHPELKDEYVIIGAHLDHVGRQGDVVFGGANDNASGSASIIELAKTFGENNIKTDRSIIFVLFSAEESGLYGAKYFAENLAVDKEKVVGMFNMDCVGHGDAIRLGGGKSAPELFEFAKNNDNLFVKKMVDNTWYGGGADAQPFFDLGIPTLYFVTQNSYTHLHKYTDTPETINRDLHEGITRLAYLTLCDVVDEQFEGTKIVPKS
ncbi:MAG: hypothetical protein SCALA702_21860 [Melioribacteraceae bacterium]|nr:MAG: hypothetical protein SCALA702_21860 [Melioribacteraceae bacterium]